MWYIPEYRILRPKHVVVSATCVQHKEIIGCNLYVTCVLTISKIKIDEGKVRVIQFSRRLIVLEEELQLNERNTPFVNNAK
jgi:hypothetical protein